MDFLGQGDWPPSSRSLLVWPGWSGSRVAAQTTGHPSSAAVVNRWLSVQGETVHLGVGDFEGTSPTSIMALFSMSKGCRKFSPGQGCQEAEGPHSEQWAVDGLRGQVLRWPHATFHCLGKPPEIPLGSVPPAPSAERVHLAFIVKDSVPWVTLPPLTQTSCLLGQTFPKNS